MRGTSADSLEALVEDLGSRVDGGDDPMGIADDLFAVSALLRREPSLRRVVTDVSVSSRAKSDLVRSLLGQQVQGGALEMRNDDQAVEDVVLLIGHDLDNRANLPVVRRVHRSPLLEDQIRDRRPELVHARAGYPASARPRMSRRAR